MPRQARQKSESGIYHVMLRGIDRVQLFYDEDDRRAFIERLSRYTSEGKVGLLAWCLMGNHAHLLIREGEHGLSCVMKKLELSYSHYFCKKYDRRGYLFQDRFKSKPVDDEGYLLAVVRYIHRNPLEAGNALTYWTSYGEYLGFPEITDTALVLGMFENNAKGSQHAFKEFIETVDETTCSFLDERYTGRILDSEAIKIILEVSKLKSCTDLGLVDKDERNCLIAQLRKRGLSVRQISRLTGIGRGIVASVKPTLRL